MASGIMSMTSRDSRLTGRIQWSSVADATTDTSTVTATLQIRKTVSATTWGTWTGWFSAKETWKDREGTDAIDVSISEYLTVGSDWVTVGRYSFTAKHESDGTCAVELGVAVYAPSGTSLAGSLIYIDSFPIIELDTIFKKATLTSVSAFTDEQNPMIEYHIPSGLSPTSVEVAIYDPEGITSYTQYYPVSLTKSSYTFNLTEAERAKLRAAVKSGSSTKVGFYLKTIKSAHDNQFDSKQATLRLVQHTPTLNPAVVDFGPGSYTELTGNSNSLIKYFNNPMVVANAAARKEAEIVDVIISNGTQRVNSEGADRAWLSNIETNTFTFTAIDSRGNTTSKNYTIDPFIEYVKLTCNFSVDIALSEADGTKAEISIVAKGNYFNGSFGAVDNTLELYYSLETGEEGGGGITYQPIEATPTFSNGTYTVRYTLPPVDYQYVYKVQIEAKDKLMTAKSDTKAVKATPVFDWGEHDFRFNVPVYMPSLTINEVPVVDFIIEEGNDGSYAYRKWYSGMLEAWRIAGSSVSVSASTGYGSMFYHDNLTLRTTGSASQFTTIKSVQLTFNKDGSAGLWYPVVKKWEVSSSGQATITYMAINPTNLSSTVIPCLYIVGRWK